MFDQLLDFVIDSVRKEEQRKADDLRKQQEDQRKCCPLGMIRVEYAARDIVEPSKKCAKYHRERQTYYVKHLEEAEKKLRESGVKFDMIERSTGNMLGYTGNITSGSMSNAGPSAEFGAVVDKAMLAAVKHSAEKVHDHETKAIAYEKYARVFALCSEEQKVSLNLEEVHYFRLGE